MSTVLEAPAAPAWLTVADLLKLLGDVPPERVRLRPTPGTATEADVLAVLDHENIPCELVEGTLVEKAMGYEESCLTTELIFFLVSFLKEHNLGVIAGPDGTIRLPVGLLRVPDVSFVSWANMPGGTRPKKPVPVLAIDLAVEVLSQGNTRAEMDRKVREYFEGGSKRVWLIDPKDRTARVYSTPDRSVLLQEADTLEGEDVLPGFVLPLRDLFAALDRGPGA
jgi:Uma2 family endonuclease